jgi:glycosyltransferase involved in cell wall biosynthesis
MKLTLLLGPSTGGIGQHVASVAKRLATKDCSVRVVGPAATNELFGFSADAEFVPLPVPSLAAVRRGRPLLAEADLIHAHGHSAGVVAAAAAPRAVPLVVSWHNDVLAGGLKHGLLSSMQRFVARRASVLLGASSDLVAEAKAMGAESARLAPVAAPALAEATRSREEVRASLGVDGPLLLAVGRLAPQKSYGVLLDALARLADRSPRPTLVIAGEGPERESLTRRIEADVLPASLLGHRTDVPDLLGAADVVVLSSRWEARALAAQEALRAGVPLVSTEVGGIPELVGDAALLVPPADDRALAAAIARVLDDPALADTLRTAGLKQAATWPDEDAAADALWDLYRELTSGTNG